MKTVLMIITSNNEMGEFGKPTGVWAEELLLPYYELADANIKVEMTSPKGGRVCFDPSSIKPKGNNDKYVERYLSDLDAEIEFQNIKKLSEVDSSKFDAIFFPGGHGAVWDLPNDALVTKTVEMAFHSNKIIAAVCHGLAGLINAKRSDGKSILFEKKISGFTDLEEEAAGLDKVVPFKLEEKIRSLGGLFEGAALWQPYAVQDGKMITGQNPASTKLVSDMMLKALSV